jgi:hypothetical protein
MQTLEKQDGQNCNTRRRIQHNSITDTTISGMPAARACSGMSRKHGGDGGETRDKKIDTTHDAEKE